MADIYLRANNAPTVTCISNTFIDEYMTEANGEYVKIYLYLIRCLNQEGMDFSISALAEKLDHTERDIRRALSYWEKKNLLHLEYNEGNEISGICLSDPHAIACDTAPISQESSWIAKEPLQQMPQPASTNKAPAPSTPNLSLFEEKDDLVELIFVSESYFNRPLTKKEMETVLFWYQDLHFATDLIEYLIEYCFENNHISIHYMNTVAINWFEEGICSVAQAKEQRKMYNSTNNEIMKAFGISGRSLVQAELTFVHKWSSELGFSMDLIQEACYRTLKNTGKPNFEYADKILSSWKKQNVSSLEDISSLEKNSKKGQANPSGSKKNRFHNFSQREYDYDKLEQQLLRQS